MWLPKCHKVTYNAMRYSSTDRVKADNYVMQISDGWLVHSGR